MVCASVFSCSCLFPCQLQEKSQKVRGIQSRIQSKLQALGSLEDELEVPRQELESRKREEQQRRRKMGTLRTEIQVCPAR